MRTKIKTFLGSAVLAFAIIAFPNKSSMAAEIEEKGLGAGTRRQATLVSVYGDDNARKVVLILDHIYGEQNMHTTYHSHAVSYTKELKDDTWACLRRKIQKAKPLERMFIIHEVSRDDYDDTMNGAFLKAIQNMYKEVPVNHIKIDSKDPIPSIVARVFPNIKRDQLEELIFIAQELAKFEPSISKDISKYCKDNIQVERLCEYPTGYALKLPEGYEGMIRDRDPALVAVLDGFFKKGMVRPGHVNYSVYKFVDRSESPYKQAFTWDSERAKFGKSYKANIAGIIYNKDAVVFDIRVSSFERGREEYCLTYALAPGKKPYDGRKLHTAWLERKGEISYYALENPIFLEVEVNPVFNIKYNMAPGYGAKPADGGEDGGDPEEAAPPAPWDVVPAYDGGGDAVVLEDGGDNALAAYQAAGAAEAPADKPISKAKQERKNDDGAKLKVAGRQKPPRHKNNIKAIQAKGKLKPAIKVPSLLPLPRQIAGAGEDINDIMNRFKEAFPYVEEEE